MAAFSPKLVLFDLDGTLVDSVPDLVQAVNRMQAQLGLPERQERDVRHWIGHGIEPLVARALTGDMHGKPTPDLLNRALVLFDRAYHEVNGRETRVFDGVFSGLVHIRSLGVPVGLMTNTPRAYTLPLLDETGLRPYFDTIQCGDDLPLKKPNPAPLIYAAGWFKVHPNDGLMVGDSISDLNAARAAGFSIICTRYGYNHGEDISDYHPDALVDSLESLRDLVG